MMRWAWIYFLVALFCMLYWPLLMHGDFEGYLDTGVVIRAGMISLFVLPVFLLTWLHPRVRSTTYIHLGKWLGNSFVIFIGIFLIFGWFVLIRLA